MGILDTFNTLETTNPMSLDDCDVQSKQFNYGDPVEAVSVAEPLKMTPNYYPSGYYEPYAGSNWYAQSVVLNTIGDSGRLPSLEQKLDPNKIFSSDLTALRTIGVEQQKIIKMFEKKIVEMLTDKGQYGVTEEMTEAINALNSLRSGLIQNQKEQIAIKGKIADIRLKQEQYREARQDTANVAGGGGVTHVSSAELGLSILDNISKYSMGSPTQSAPVDMDPGQYQSMDPVSAADTLDSLMNDTISPYIQYESLSPKVCVVVGDSDADAEFVTFSDNGNGVPLPDYPKPSAKIEKIDRSANIAYDDRMVPYEIKPKSALE